MPSLSPLEAVPCISYCKCVQLHALPKDVAKVGCLQPITNGCCKGGMPAALDRVIDGYHRYACMLSQVGCLHPLVGGDIWYPMLSMLTAVVLPRTLPTVTIGIRAVALLQWQWSHPGRVIQAVQLQVGVASGCCKWNVCISCGVRNSEW